jgi:TFIIF-interacting CTD phosphatase-like protein
MQRRFLSACAKSASRTLKASFSTTLSDTIPRDQTQTIRRLHFIRPLNSSFPAQTSPISQSRLHRSYATHRTADEALEHLTDLYATAKDEFEIAAEETEQNTIYAADDRAAARAELTKLQDAYRAVVDEGQDAQLAEEVKRRVGSRVRELERAVEAMEEAAMNQD